VEIVYFGGGIASVEKKLNSYCQGFKCLTKCYRTCSCAEPLHGRGFGVVDDDDGPLERWAMNA